jgi:hypothetical protein
MKVKSIEKFWSNEKEWVKVVFDTGEVWLPAFSELGKIVFLIGQCEDNRYFMKGGRGLDLTREFLEEAILTGITYEEFCKNKGIPTKL